MLKIYDSDERVGARCMCDIITFIPNLLGPQVYRTSFGCFFILLRDSSSLSTFRISIPWDWERGSEGEFRSEGVGV